MKILDTRKFALAALVGSLSFAPAAFAADSAAEETFLAQANAAMQANTLTQVPVLFGLTFGEDGALNSDRLVAQYESMKSQLGTEPLASLRMALSDVMFFLLFQAGELLESRADEDLARRVKELLATLEMQ